MPATVAAVAAGTGRAIGKVVDWPTIGGSGAARDSGRSSMPLLDGDGWHGKIYSGGWTDGSGESYDVVSPSTGETLGRSGLATAADVHKAAAAAADAQRDWASRPYVERAAVLRRVGD